MSAAYKIAKPLLMRMDAEDAHNMTLRALKAGLHPRPLFKDEPALSVKLWNRTFPNPIGLAAGFDKNADVIAPCLRLGFGFVEAGTVTPKPQEGNPRPRVFRDETARAVINRMGFPNRGMENFRANMEALLARPRPPGVIGINIGMNKDQSEPAEDYCRLIKNLGGYADYIVINISSPNTPGLRNLQERGAFLDLTAKVLKQREECCTINPPPLLVKLAPDLTEDQQAELAQAAVQSGIDGLILTNTTLERPDTLPRDFAEERGGLSGEPVRERSMKIIRNFYALTGGRIPLIGLGGISCGSEAYARIRAGASLVQLYTALVFKGPSVVWDIRETLLARLKADGFTHIAQAVGADHR